MPRYRKKPVEVDVSVPWTGENYTAMSAFASMALLRVLSLNGRDSFQVWNALEKCYVNIPLGHHLIKGVKGEFYPIDPEVLDATYERVDDLGLDIDRLPD